MWIHKGELVYPDVNPQRRACISGCESTKESLYIRMWIHKSTKESLYIRMWIHKGELVYPDVNSQHSTLETIMSKYHRAIRTSDGTCPDHITSIRRQIKKSAFVTVKSQITSRWSRVYSNSCNAIQNTYSRCYEAVLVPNLSENFLFLSCSNEKLSRSNEKVSRSNEKVSRSNEKLSRSNETVSRSNEIISR